MSQNPSRMSSDKKAEVDAFKSGVLVGEQDNGFTSRTDTYPLSVLFKENTEAGEAEGVTLWAR